MWVFWSFARIRRLNLQLLHSLLQSRNMWQMPWSRSGLCLVYWHGEKLFFHKNKFFLQYSKKFKIKLVKHIQVSSKKKTDKKHVKMLIRKMFTNHKRTYEKFFCRTFRKWSKKKNFYGNRNEIIQSVMYEMTPEMFEVILKSLKVLLKKKQNSRKKNEKLSSCFNIDWTK